MAIFFEWDDQKAARNLLIHGVSFKTARGVFYDRYRLTMEDSIVDNEQRWRTLGTAAGIAILIVVHLEEAFGNDLFVRIISARKATRVEWREYEQNRANDI